MKWCCQVRWVAVELLAGGEAEASLLEISKGAPLELEWVGVGREFVGWVVVSSCEKFLGVVVWLLVGYR